MWRNAFGAVPGIVLRVGLENPDTNEAGNDAALDPAWMDG